MPIVEPAMLRPALPPGSRLLGFDVGEKTIGLAVSDPGLAVASPLVTLRRGKFTADAERLARLVAERGIGGVVIGLPVNMDGSEGPRCQSVRAVRRQPAGPDRAAARLLGRADVHALRRPDADRRGRHVTRRRGELVDKLAAA